MIKESFNSKEIIGRLTDGYYLSRAESAELMEHVVSENISQIQLGSILSLMNTRPFAREEILGFREGILRHSTAIDLDSFDPIDVCGTGGDGRNSFNISTAAALLIASVGIPVAKHGNYAVSSLCGSSNILEAMGYRPTNNQDKLKREIEKTNFTFLHAPLFHPAMKAVAPIRKELGVKTIFNCLGPLLNPASVRYQLAGVYSVSVFDLYRQVLASLSKKRGGEYCVVFSTDTADEITLTAPAKIAFRDSEVLLRPGGHVSYEGVFFP